MNNIQMESQILQVPIEDIIPNRFQPRLSFDDASLADLASSIKQHGIIQPLVLRRKNDKYEIIAGERRFKAAKMAGLVSVPAVISNLDDNASAEVAIVENIQRKDLTAIEEAKSFQALLVPSHEKQRELLNKVINERLTVKQLEDEIKNIDTTSGSIVEQPKNNEIDKTESLETITQKEAPVENINTPSSQNIDTLPNIEDIFTDVSELKDITKEDTLDDVKPSPSITPDAFFSNPEKMPNKFFNFLEDTAANMDIEEITPTFEIPKVESKPQPENLINQTDNIEMLDDFFIPTTDNKVESSNNDYLNEVIKTIRNLHLDSDKVVVEEMNLPTEYHINIKIKKDLNN